MPRLGVVMDPIGSIKPYKDTTLALMLAAQKRGWQLVYFELGDLWLRDGVAWGRGRRVTVADDKRNWYQFDSQAEALRLGELDAILMRKDPPFDLEYVTATYLLERAEAQGALVVNRPDSLRDCNEKMFTAWFPELCPPTLFSRDAATLRAFHAEHGDVIYKPVDGMGGMGIFRVREDGLNLGSITETLNKFGSQTLMVQRFLPEIAQGDKRILLIGGEPVPHSLARIPQGSEVRGNLAAGGKGVALPLSARDREIAEALGPVLAARGLLLVGLDVIGDCLTEINVTSPTGFQEITQQTGFDVARRFVDALEAALAA